MGDTDALARDTGPGRPHESWYRDERTGRAGLLWPDSATSFRDRLATFTGVSYEHLRQRRHG
jgi:hypothetical protein